MDHGVFISCLLKKYFFGLGASKNMAAECYWLFLELERAIFGRFFKIFNFLAVLLFIDYTSPFILQNTKNKRTEMLCKKNLTLKICQKGYLIRNNFLKKLGGLRFEPRTFVLRPRCFNHYFRKCNTWQTKVFKMKMHVEAKPVALKHLNDPLLMMQDVNKM